MFEHDYIDIKYLEDTDEFNSETVVVDNVCSEDSDVSINDSYLPIQEMSQFPSGWGGQ